MFVKMVPRKIFDPKRKQQKDEENSIMSRFKMYTPHRILSELSNH